MDKTKPKAAWNHCEMYNKLFSSGVLFLVSIRAIHVSAIFVMNSLSTQSKMGVFSSNRYLNLLYIRQWQTQNMVCLQFVLPNSDGTNEQPTAELSWKREAVSESVSLLNTGVLTLFLSIVKAFQCRLQTFLNFQVYKERELIDSTCKRHDDSNLGLSLEKCI